MTGHKKCNGSQEIWTSQKTKPRLRNDIIAIICMASQQSTCLPDIHYGRNRNLELTGVNLTHATTYPRRSGMKIMETRKLQGDTQKQGTRAETQTRKIDRWVYPTNISTLLAQMAHGSRTGKQGLCSRGGHKRGERRRNRNKQEAAFCAR